MYRLGELLSLAGALVELGLRVSGWVCSHFGDYNAAANGENRHKTDA
jgi:hypothetical protein